MNLLQHLMESMERLRPIVGLKSWDYCVIWKFSEDQRYLECMDCCCAGTDHHQAIHQSNGTGEELLFPVSSLLACKDIMFPHPRTKSCDLLSQLPSSIPLDSGIHAHTLISNQPRWFNFANSLDSNGLEETVGTRVLIPVPFGLIELFVDKQLAEDQNLIDFVTSQFNITLDHQPLINKSHGDSSFLTDYKADPDDIFRQPPVSPATMIQNLNLHEEIPIDHNNSPMNFFQQFKNGRIFQESNSETFPPAENPFPGENGGFEEEIDALQKGMNAVEVLPGKKRQLGNNVEKESLTRSDSMSGCSDLNEEEEEGGKDNRRRNGNGKGPQSKNLVAERKRRKKLNDRLYNLRSLVPKISKLDRASILGDAIEYVMELQKQVTDLQNELEEHSEEDENNNNNNNHSAVQSEVVQGNANNFGTKSDQNLPNETSRIGALQGSGVEISKQSQDQEVDNDHKVQQMEPQVEVAQLDGNEFFVKMFCEHKAGGFVKLMEAFNSLGLEVTNVNVTSFRSLVVNVFKVEKKDSEMVQAEHVRDSLLELARNPSKGWLEDPKVSENGSGIDHGHRHHYHHHSFLHNHQHLNPQPHPLHHHHHHRHIHHIHN
ncbi:hypothetical protein LguiB_022409 [Lonicera macranthoides]